MITREFQVFTFGGTPGGSSTSKNWFLSRFASEACFQMRLGTIDNRAQRISDALQW